MLLEWIPNFSLVKRHPASAEIYHTMLKFGLEVRDIHSSEAANRSVYTVIGQAEQIEQAVFSILDILLQSVDMNTHRGIHPRMGALDICPFVPLRNTTMEETIAFAKHLGEKIGAYGLPVYLYANTASSKERVRIHEIRRFQFEKLDEGMKIHPPDFGPLQKHPTLGAIGVSARDFLLAWNFALSGISLEQGHLIAAQIRDYAKVFRDHHGRIHWVEHGQCPGVQAICWENTDHGHIEISTNTLVLSHTPPKNLYKSIESEVTKIGGRIVRTELIGCIPWTAIKSSTPETMQDEERMSFFTQQYQLIPFSKARVLYP